VVLSGTPASSTTKTGRHDIAESGVKHKKSIKSDKGFVGNRGNTMSV
jgi:hypothetical protein